MKSFGKFILLLIAGVFLFSSGWWIGIKVENRFDKKKRLIEQNVEALLAGEKQAVTTDAIKEE